MGFAKTALILASAHVRALPWAETVVCTVTGASLASMALSLTTLARYISIRKRQDLDHSLTLFSTK